MKETHVIVRTSLDLRAGFKAAAENEGQTMSDMIREFMESTVARKGQNG